MKTRFTYYKVIIDKRHSSMFNEYVYRKNYDTFEYYHKSTCSWKTSSYTLRGKVFYKRETGSKRTQMYTITRLTKGEAFLELL